jgi:hypothetical protein
MPNLETPDANVVVISEDGLTGDTAEIVESSGTALIAVGVPAIVKYS